MINRINIVVDEQTDMMDGHSNISIDNIRQITNGYVNNIVFNTIDKIDQKNRDSVFIELLKKLTHGGSITLKFINPESVAKRIRSSSLTGAGFTSCIKDIKSVWMQPEFLGLLSSISGFNLIKNIHEDIYSIVVISKST
jgi:hypothetical protein